MKFTRECPNCIKEIEYSRKYDKDQANKINKICYECKMKQKVGNPDDWFRNCPECDTKITYTNKGNMQAANKVGKKCLKCTKKEKRGVTEFTKNCPKCKEPIYFKNKVSLDESVVNNAQCGPCRSKEAIERQTGQGNKGMMLTKYGIEDGMKRWEESEKKRIASFNKYWEEHPDEYNKLMEKRKNFKCKFYYVNEIRCQGNSERIYLEYLINNNIVLPIKTKGIKTPYGFTFPDFEYPDHYIEIKSPWTYLLMKKPNYIQYLKMKWVANNIKPIKIISVDHKGNIEAVEILT